MVVCYDAPICLLLKIRFPLLSHCIPSCSLLPHYLGSSLIGDKVLMNGEKFHLSLSVLPYILPSLIQGQASHASGPGSQASRKVLENMEKICVRACVCACMKANFYNSWQLALTWRLMQAISRPKPITSWRTLVGGVMTKVKGFFMGSKGSFI